MIVGNSCHTLACTYNILISGLRFTWLLLYVFVLKFLSSKDVNLCIGVSEAYSHTVVSTSLLQQGLQPARLLCPWNSPGKKTGAGCHFLLQGIFPTQDQTSISRVFRIAGESLPLSHWRSPTKLRDSFKTQRVVNLTLGILPTFHSGPSRRNAGYQSTYLE